MAGFPLSLNFAAHWGLYRVIAETNLFQAILALMGCAGVMMGVIGVARMLFAPLPKAAPQERTATQEPVATLEPVDKGSAREDPVVLFLIIVLIGLTLALGIFPGSIGQIALHMAEGFTFF